MMRSLRKATTLGALPLILLTAAASAQDAIRLAPRFSTERPLYVEQSTRTLRRMEKPGGGIASTSRSESLYGMVVNVLESGPDGSARLRFRIDRVRLVEDGPGATPVDTDESPASAPSGPAAAAARVMLGKSVEMAVGPQGCRVDADHIAALQDAIGKAIGGDARFLFLLDEFSADRFRYSWGDARLALYAWKDVKAGESWEQPLRQTMPDGNVTTYEYKTRLHHVETIDGRRCAKLEFEGRVHQDADAAIKATPESRLTMSLKSGTFRGRATFDIANGEITAQDTAAELEVGIVSKDASGATREMTLRQSLESRTTIQPAATRVKARAK